MPTTTLIRRSLTAALLAAAVALTAPVRPSQAAPAATAVRELSIPYTAYNGETSHASVLVPASYDPQSDPPLPLVISPHGRGLDGTTNGVTVYAPARSSSSGCSPTAGCCARRNAA